MGCNTSQEAIVSTNECSKNEQKDEEKVNKDEDSSCRLIRLKSVTSNGVTSETENGNKTPTGDLEEAAIKIQAAFRGHQSRKTMKQHSKQEQGSSSAQNLEEEFSADDKELCHAATKIQASFRGHMARKEIDKKDKEGHSDERTKEEEELDIDLSDPELNKAAVKIQASFRGHMVRKDEAESSNCK